MQKDLLITERVLADIANHLAVKPDDAYAASLAANIRNWRCELYTCHLLTLPRDLLCLVLKKFSLPELNRLRLVCKTLKAIADSDTLWRHNCEQRTQPTWREEYRNNHSLWKAAEENLAQHLLQMEMAIAWKSVNELVFRPRRQGWVDEVRAMQKQSDTKKYGELLAELVDVILPQFFTPAWKSNEQEWRARIHSVKRMAEFGVLLLALDECVDVTAYTYQPHNNTLRSRYQNLTSILPLKVPSPAPSGWVPGTSVPAEATVTAAG